MNDVKLKALIKKRSDVKKSLLDLNETIKDIKNKKIYYNIHPPEWVYYNYKLNELYIKSNTIGRLEAKYYERLTKKYNICLGLL